jgi:hypothetical protein
MIWPRIIEGLRWIGTDKNYIIHTFLKQTQILNSIEIRLVFPEMKHQDGQNVPRNYSYFDGFRAKSTQMRV